MAESHAQCFGGKLARCHGAADEVGKSEAGITSQSGFMCATDSKNIGRTLQSIRWRTLKSGTCKRTGFGIPRGIDERVHFEIKDMASRLKTRGLDFT
jgi:hypothetical protein